MNKKTTIIAAIVVISLMLLAVAAASVVLSAPEHAADTPLNPTPVPTAVPTATPSPSPVPTITPTELHLSSNLTVGSFYKGDTLHIVGTLNQPVAGITVTLYNNGVVVTVNGVAVTAQTDASGKVFFDRQPQNTFDYTIKASV
jgi:hypothetical protein